MLSSVFQFSSGLHRATLHRRRDNQPYSQPRVEGTNHCQRINFRRIKIDVDASSFLPPSQIANAIELVAETRTRYAEMLMHPNNRFNIGFLPTRQGSWPRKGLLRNCHTNVSFSRLLCCALHHLTIERRRADRWYAWMYLGLILWLRHLS